MTTARLKRFAKDRHVMATYSVGSVIVVSTLYFLLPFFGHQGNIIFHMNANGLVDVLAGAVSLMVVTALFFCMLFTNALLSYFLYWRERVVSYGIMYGSLWLIILYAFFVWRVNQFN